MTSSSAVAVITDEERALLAGLDLGVAGTENLEKGDIGMPPRLRISQPNRPIKIGDGKAAPGSIVNTLTGEQWTKLELVVVVYRPHTRALWPEPFNANDKPLCVSDDGVHPTRGDEMMTGPCRTCPMAQFVDGKKPRCADQRNFLVWLPDIGEPAILTMQSTAIKEAKQLTALAQTQGLKKTVTMTALQIEDSRGTWFVPRFSKGRPLPVKEILEIVEIRDELKNLQTFADTERIEYDDAEPAQEQTYSGRNVPTEDIPF